MGKGHINLTTVYKWHRQFLSGEISEKDIQRSGGPKRVKRVTATIKELIMNHIQSVVQTFTQERYTQISQDWILRHEGVVTHRGMYFERLWVVT